MRYSPDIIIILDADGRFIYCTENFIAMLGIKNFGQIRGRKFMEIARPMLRDGAFELEYAFDDAMSERQNISLDVSMESGGAEKRVFSANIAPMQDQEGSVVGVMAVFRDLSYMMQARQAIAASQAKSAFLANISHEIRTPLNAIIGLSDIALQSGLPNETRPIFEKISASGVNLLSLINDILDISKIESGKFEIVPVNYDFAGMMTDTVGLNVVRIGSKPVVFKAEIDEKIPRRLYGDEIRVKQILNNLLSNAFKFTREGEVRLTVSCGVEGDDASLTFSISDTGSGIRQEDLTRLFTEYRRFDSAANRNIEGTGLGLSICKNLVDLMDGSISVVSEFGVGTIFTVKLRQKIIDRQPVGAETARAIRDMDFSVIGGRGDKKLERAYMPYASVLVVDDVATNLDVAKGLMSPYGLSVDCASSGEQAIAMIREGKKKYDVIFMDHMMPIMDGVETVRKIRGEIGTDYARSVPIIALTANAVVGSSEMFLENGFQSFLSKPIDIFKLDEILNAWIRDKQVAKTLEEAEKTKRGKDAAEPGAKWSELSQKQIKGLDLDAGLKRFGGDPALFLPVLRSYAAHTPALLDKVRSVTKDSLGEYAVTIHGLKGASYGICANEAGSMADSLERAAKAGDFDFVAAHNETFIAVAESLLRELSALMEENVERAPKEIKPEPDAKLLAELRDACERFRMDDMNRLLGEIDKYEYENLSGLARELRELAYNIEYEEISRRLDEILGGTA
jgi:PAS domain S-box-containing protein